MIKIMFVCHGNICRSPLAEFIMKDIAKKNGTQKLFEIASAATSTEEIGNPVHSQSKRILRNMGIDCGMKRAVQITKRDYEYYDYIVCMDNNNLRNLKRVIGCDLSDKVSLLMEFAGERRDVADPWYTGDFSTAANDITFGCNALYNRLINR